MARELCVVGNTQAPPLADPIDQMEEILMLDQWPASNGVHPYTSGLWRPETVVRPVVEGCNKSDKCTSESVAGHG